MRLSVTRAACQLSFACLLSSRPGARSSVIRRTSATRFQPHSQAALGGGRQAKAPHNHTRVQAMQTNSWQYPTPLSFQAKTKHTATVILLHGLGDTANGWADFAPMLQLQMPHVKFVFPTAPTRPITLNGGMRMTGWFDILSLDKLKMKEDKAGLEDAVQYVALCPDWHPDNATSAAVRSKNLESLVQAEEAQGINSKRVLIAGFSQGGAVSMLMLRSRLQVAAVLGMSTWLPLAEEPPLVSAENQQTPVLMCHGNKDGVVQYVYGQESFQKLKSAGSPIEFKTYQGLGHGVDPQEVQDITSFMRRYLPST